MAAPYPTSQSELTARVVALEAGLTALRQVLDERDARYSQRASSQDAAVRTAQETSEKAINKAEIATERRLEGLNELRDMAADQASKLMSRAEFIVQHQATIDKIQLNEDRLGVLQKDISDIQARGGGMKELWGYLIGLGGLILVALEVYFRHGG